MITRLVTMTFKDESVKEFLDIFESNKEKIRCFDGCQSLQLIQNPDNPVEISTLSTWNKEDSLNEYRKSELFGMVWPKTKKLFSAAPIAKTFKILHSL